MTYQPFFVGPITTGLQLDLDSYLIPETAFPTLLNAYLWRGRVYKKGGNQILGNTGGRATPLTYAGRMGIRFDDNLSPGAANIVVRAGAPQAYNVTLDNVPIEPGTVTVTDGVTVFKDDGAGNMVVTAGAGTAGVIAYNTGVTTFTFNALNNGAVVTATYITVVGNNSPVMGLEGQDVLGTIQQNLIGFDLIKSYKFNKSTGQFDWIRFYKLSPTVSTAQTTHNYVSWTGSNHDFFASTNYQGAFFETNNIAGANFYIITNITNAASGVVTFSTNHNFVAGDVVFIANVQDALGPQINNATYLVKAPVGANTITIDFNTAALNAYTSGGIGWMVTKTKTTPAPAGDGIRWYDGTGYVNFEPPTDNSGSPNIVQGCLLIMPYKDRMIMLNTQEGVAGIAPTNFPQRCRYSQNGNIFFATVPTGNTQVPSGQEWYNSPGRGGFIDAPTGENIISAEFIKDTLVVFFENSTYRLAYTGNSTQPFFWEKVNTEIGCRSTFSVVPFDREVLEIAQNGAYGCDSINIERIDRIIPDVVFGFSNDNFGTFRVHGIRDFYNEMVYWTYPDGATNAVFPNKSLIYNYVTPSYSIFEDSYTKFGHFYTATDVTWSQENESWNDISRTWASPQGQAGFPIVVAGNQEGFVFQLQEADGGAFQQNDTSLVIQNITNAAPAVFTVPNHNLQVGQFVIIFTLQGALSALNGVIFQVATIPSVNTLTLFQENGQLLNTPGVYTFGGRLAVKDNFNIITKNLNPFFSTGRSMRLGYADIMVETVPLSLVNVDAYNNNNSIDIVDSAQMQLTDQTLSSQDLTWVRVFFHVQGQFVSLSFNYTTQFLTPTSAAGLMWDPGLNTTEVPFVIHGMTFWMAPSGRSVR